MQACTSSPCLTRRPGVRELAAPLTAAADAGARQAGSGLPAERGRHGVGVPAAALGVCMPHCTARAQPGQGRERARAVGAQAQANSLPMQQARVRCRAAQAAAACSGAVASRRAGRARAHGHNQHLHRRCSLIDCADASMAAYGCACRAEARCCNMCMAAQRGPATVHGHHSVRASAGRGPCVTSSKVAACKKALKGKTEGQARARASVCRMG